MLRDGYYEISALGLINFRRGARDCEATRSAKAGLILIGVGKTHVCNSERGEAKRRAIASI